MIQDELKYRIIQALGLPPTSEQEQALNVFTQFMTDRSDQVVMILRGSAGTGKTTLAGAIVRAMVALKQKLILLAPTGRAAKVFSLNAGHAAYTIHRRIYRQKSAGDLSAFNLNDNLNRVWARQSKSPILPSRMKRARRRLNELVWFPSGSCP